MIILTSTYYKPHIGGVENSLFFLADAYNKIGKKVVIVSSDKGKGKYRLNKFELIDNIEVIRYKSYTKGGVLGSFLKPIIELIRIRRVLQEIKKKSEVDLVIARNHINSLASSSLRLETKYLVPGIYINQSKTNLITVNRIKKFILLNIVFPYQSLFQILALNKANGIYVFSVAMKDQIKTLLKKNIPIAIVNPGVDIEKFSKTNDLNIKTKYKLNNDFVFLCVGRLVKEKGFSYAIEALSKMKNVKTKLLIVGEGVEYNNLNEITKQLQLEDRVVFAGGITQNVEDFYLMSNAFLLTSVKETFGQIVLEALASKLPIIAWKSGGAINTATSEILKNKTNGFLIDFDIEKLAYFMDRISLMHKQELTIIGSENYKLATSKYCWINLAKSLMYEDN